MLSVDSVIQNAIKSGWVIQEDYRSPTEGYPGWIATSPSGQCYGQAYTGEMPENANQLIRQHMADIIQVVETGRIQ